MRTLAHLTFPPVFSHFPHFSPFFATDFVLLAEFWVTLLIVFNVSSWLTDVLVRIVGNAQLPNAPSLVTLTTANGQSCLHKAAMGDTPGHVACVRLLAGPEANQVRRQPARTLNLNSQRLSVWLWCGFAGDADEAGPRLAERRAPRRRARIPAGEIL